MIPDLGTILGVWAHPDDECYLSGALMADAVQAGRRVVCVTATRGEMADPDNVAPDEMARIREREMEACMAVLGVTDHRWLDYADAGCHLVPDDEAAAKIAAIIGEVDPDTVLTFGPEGMTGHTDHMAVSRWSKRAIELAGSDARLLYASHTPEWGDGFREIAEQLNVMMADIEVPTTPSSEAAVFICAEGDLLTIKERAMRAQASQVQIMVDTMGEAMYRQLLAEEVFRTSD